MTHRERLLAVFAGRLPDKIPWFPRLDMWYDAHSRAGTLPEKYRDWDLRDIYRDLDLGFHGKWGTAYRIEVDGIETVTRRDGEETRVDTITPVGTVSSLTRHSPDRGPG